MSIVLAHGTSFTKWQRSQAEYRVSEHYSIPTVGDRRYNCLA
jgi:hypothetical protein